MAEFVGAGLAPALIVGRPQDARWATVRLRRTPTRNNMSYNKTIGIAIIVKRTLVAIPARTCPPKAGAKQAGVVLPRQKLFCISF